MRILFIIIIAINILYPSFDTFNQTYQTSLLTSGSRDLGRHFDIQFQIGPNIDGFQKWKRVKIGFPQSPLIIDTQFESRIIQVRFHTLGFLINLIPTYIIVTLILIRRLMERKSVTRNGGNNL